MVTEPEEEEDLTTVEKPEAEGFLSVFKELVEEEVEEEEEEEVEDLPPDVEEEGFSCIRIGAGGRGLDSCITVGFNGT